jgi:NAD(P)-dependent dehydrogenase (short-subunit alcohol dehydrogenase family)
MIFDSFKLDGKVALVTGASAGLGAAIAVALAEAGADVAAHGNSRPPDATCELIERTGHRALPVLGNLADKAVPKSTGLANACSLWTVGHSHQQRGYDPPLAGG